ncbi:hypothetical protein AHAS_Ahas03G0032700 [Arachis hypogaea]
MASTTAVSATGSGLIVSFSEMFIDFVPTVSGVSLAGAPGFLKAPGGAPANVAIAVSRLGGKSAFVGKLGDDEFGHMLAGILKENNVVADGIAFDEGARTALAFVTLRSDGEREFMFYRNPSADMLLKPEDLNLDLIISAKVFHYGSISLIVEPCRSAHVKAMEVAKEAGCLLSYDPNLRLPLWPSAEEARKQILSIWEKADVIKVSDNELEFLTGSDKIDYASALSLWHPNLKLLLVTLGEHGSRYYTKVIIASTSITDNALPKYLKMDHSKYVEGRNDEPQLMKPTTDMTLTSQTLQTNKEYLDANGNENSSNPEGVNERNRQNIQLCKKWRGPTKLATTNGLPIDRQPKLKCHILQRHRALSKRHKKSVPLGAPPLNGCIDQRLVLPEPAAV